MKKGKKQKKHLKIIEKLASIYSLVKNGSVGNSVDLVVKCVAAAHLKILWQEKENLGKLLEADIKSLPEFQRFSLTELQVHLYINQAAFEESISNLIESMFFFSWNKYTNKFANYSCTYIR